MPFAIAVLFAAGCGSSPAAPTFPILKGPGPYHLYLTGFANSTVPEVPSCLPPVAALTEARVYLDVSRGDVDFWIGRPSSSAFPDLEFRIQGDEEVTGGFEVSGSIEGTALDSSYPGGLKGLHPEFAITVKISGATGGAALVKGLAERSGQSISGTITGDIRFTNGRGDVTRCTAVTWSLKPVPSPLS